MSELFLASYVLLWILVVGSLIAIAALYFQVGSIMLGTRSAIARDGPAIGAELQEISTAQGGVSLHDGHHLLLFGVAGCTICESLAPELAEASRLGEVRATVHLLRWSVSGGEPKETSDADVGWIGIDRRVVARLRIRVSPFAVLVEDGIVKAKGVVNNVRDVQGVAGAPA